MNAVRDVVEPAERLTIVRTESMVIITAGDGRTTRLAPDNSKIKDLESGIERRTRWEGDKLVTEISGIGRGKATETYSLDPQTHQLIVVLDMGSDGEAERSGKDDAQTDDGARASGGRGRGGRGPGGPGGGMPPVPKRRVYDPIP